MGGCCQAQQWIGREKEGAVASRQVGKKGGQLPDTVVDRWGKERDCCQTQQ